jgi:hypothetical protein
MRLLKAVLELLALAALTIGLFLLAVLAWVLTP